MSEDDQNTDRHRKNGEAGNDQGDGKEAARIRNRRDLPESDGRERDPRLINRVDQRKTVYGHVADRSEEHNQDCEDQREAKRFELTVNIGE